jgi:hypothetical protein
LTRKQKKAAKKAKKGAKKAAKQAKKDAKKAAKQAKKDAKKAKKAAKRAAKLRAKKIKFAKESGNPLTMVMLGMKHLQDCQVDIVSTDSNLADCLEEAFYDAGAEHVEKKAN